MTIQIEELLKLPAKEREYIVGELYESLLHEEYDEDPKVIEMLDKRIADMESGKTTLLTESEFQEKLSSLRKKISK